MKVEARSVDDLIAGSGARAEDMRRLDALIRATAPELKRQLFAGPSITMIGYGELAWRNLSKSGVWPLLALAPQKHHMSLYVAAERGGLSLVQLEGDRLGRTSLGSYCIRFRCYLDLDEQAVASFIRAAIAAAADQKAIFGRDCARPVAAKETASRPKQRSRGGKESPARANSKKGRNRS